MALSVHSWHSIRLSAHEGGPGQIARSTSEIMNTIIKFKVTIVKNWENHGNIMGKNTIIIIAIFGHFMGKLCLNNWFNGLIGFFRSGLA